MQNLIQLGCWNDAAYKIGAQRFVAADITSPYASSNPNAAYFQDVWQQSVDEVFEEHVWSFAINTCPLIPLNPPLWLESTSYAIGNYVLYGGSIYVCLVAYTSTSSFSADLAAGYWQIQYPSDVPDNAPNWTTGVPYTVGCIVYQSGNVYQCVVANTAGVFATDLANGYWAQVATGNLGPAAWVTATVYTIGQFVTQGGNIYKCLANNTSGTFATDLANGLWVIVNTLSPLIQPLPLMNDGCNSPYAVPTDFVNPYLFGACTFYRKEKIRPPYLPSSQVCLILTNSNVATMKYVFENLTIGDWSAKFFKAVSTKLAYNLCFKISNAAQYAQGLTAQYKIDLESAIAADSNTTSPDQAIADEWFIARLTGVNNLAPWGITQGSPNPEPY